MKNFVDIPEIAPSHMERIVLAYNQLETLRKKLGSVHDRTADFKSRRAAAAEKIREGKEAAEEAQKALRQLVLRDGDANEAKAKLARIEFNNSLAVLKEFHRELERLDSTERVELEKEAADLEKQCAETETELWIAVNQAEMLRFADLARRIIHRLHVSKANTRSPGSLPVALNQFVSELLAGDCGKISPDDILREYLDH